MSHLAMDKKGDIQGLRRSIFLQKNIVGWMDIRLYPDNVYKKCQCTLGYPAKFLLYGFSELFPDG
jgi:hypothetical protein